MNTAQTVVEWYGPEVNPENIKVAWGWDNDKAHKPAHYELIYKDFLRMAERIKNPNLYSQKVTYDGFQILHFNTNTNQLFGTVRKWVWDPKSMQRQLMDLVFTMSRTELVIEYRGNNRPGVVIYRLCYDPGNFQNWRREHDGRQQWTLVQDSTPRQENVSAFPLEGKQFTRWLSRNLASVRTTLNSTSSDNLTWLIGTLDAWQVKDMGEADFEQLRVVAGAYNQVMDELGFNRLLPGFDTEQVHFTHEAVTRLMRALDPLTKPDTPALGHVWASKISDRKMLQVTLDPNDPNPIETVKFLVEEYRKERYPGTTMNVANRASKGPNWS